MSEVWKQSIVDGFEVSSLGRVRKADGTVKKLYTSDRGYKTTTMGGKVYKVHRLVGFAFLPNPNNKPNINHINGITGDNRVENLEWCTQSENARHAIRTGLWGPQHGEHNPKSKLTEAQVREIITSHKRVKDIAKAYGITTGTVCNIRKRRLWPHIKTHYSDLLNGRPSNNTKS